MKTDIIKPMSFKAENFETHEEDKKISQALSLEHDNVPQKGIIKGILLILSVSLLVSISLFIDSLLFAKEIFEVSIFLGYLYISLWGILLYYFILFLFSQYEQFSTLGKVEKFQNGLQKARGEELFHYGYAFIDSYKDKLGNKKVNELKNQLRLLNQDEVVDFLKTSILIDFDNKVEKIIFKYAKENGVVTALSQMAMLDLVFLLWRNSRMIGEIAIMYGFKMGLTGKLILIRKVFEQLLFIGITDIVEKSAGALAGQTMASKLSSSIAQGVGHSVFTIRIGISAMKVCRPIKEENITLINKFFKKSMNPFNMFKK